MKKLILVPGLLLATASIAHAASMLNLAGTYSCQGLNAIGHNPTRIDGSFRLIKVGYTYRLQQLDSQTKQPIKNAYTEVAVQNGAALAIAYQDRRNAKILGAEVMQITDEKPLKLSGTFVELSQPNKKGDEVCQRVSPT